MRTRTGPKESSAHAAQPFFGAHAGASPFFAPMVQAKCAACDEEDKLQRQAEPEKAPQVQANAGGEGRPPALIQAKCACAGEAPTLQRRGAIQPKLAIGAPGDRFENEADQVADSVMRAPAPDAGPLQAGTVQPRRIQREATDSCSVKEVPKEEGEEEEETEDIHPDEVAAEQAPPTPVSPKRDPGEVSPPPDMEARLESSRGGGVPLAASTRDFMESRFGYDFSGVRVHAGATSEGLNRDVRSLAFTSGSDIYFGSGQYRPDTDSGKHLLAHELTHVVQQSGPAGGGGIVREKSDPTRIARARDFEEKPYYSGGGGWTSGTATHAVLENLLREHDTELVTEAAIPGANRFIPQMNLIGVADLYKSSPALTVAGVKAYKGGDKDQDFVNMNNPTSVGTHPAVTSAPSRKTLKSGGRDWVGDFPSDVWLGEIKPFSTSKLVAGAAQLLSYTGGYQKFVERAHQVSGGKTCGSIKVHRLDLKIPDWLNLDNWATFQGKPSKSTSGDKQVRLWVGSAGNGVYLYAALPAGKDVTPPQAYFDHLAEMRKTVVGPLSEPAKKTARMKFISPATRLAISRADSGGGATRRVQRNTSERGATYWSDRARDWEKVRSEWGKRFRAFAKGGLSAHRAKVRFEKALGRAGRPLKPVEKTEVKEYKSLMFWSGRAGKFLGKVRFLLGGAWDKALGIFEKMKEKMGGVRKKIADIKEGAGIKISWAKRLVQVVVAVCKVAFSAFITESFNFFAECFESAMDKVIQKFQEEINERFGEQICRARKLFEESKERLEREWGDVITELEGLVQAIQDAKRWTDIATTAVDLIRLGVQVVACLSPPGLGCLWGLVAQLGIGAMVGLVIGTQWFNENIITPNVRKLLREYVAPHYQNMINRVLGEGLKEYHCHAADNAIPTMQFEAKGGLANGSAELRAHRDAWEAENEPEILKDLQSVFEKPGGKKISKAEFLDLARKIQESKLSKEQLKELIERTRNPESGKLKIEAAKQAAEKQEMPPPPPAKVRTIDYPKASRQNVIYQKLRGWDPVTFVKKPGIKVDSEEFANAVYDMQEALHVKADGILGDETLVAFYHRNKKKEDLPYKEATRALEEKRAAEAERAAKKEKEKKAAKEAKEKAAAQGPAAPALPPGVKVLKAHQALPDDRSEVVPKGIGIYIPGVWDLISWTDNPRDYSMRRTPPTVTLDVHVNGKHEFRIQHVAVRRIYIAKLAGSAFCWWNLALDMQDGIQVDTSNGRLVKNFMYWCLPD